MLEVLMMTMGKLIIGLNDWPTRTASNLQQSHLDLTSCQLFFWGSLKCVSVSDCFNDYKLTSTSKGLVSCSANSVM